MNLIELYAASKDDYLLENENWKYADFYNLSTNNSHWNNAMILIISKKYAKNNREAFLYLLQKQAKVLKIWEAEWNATTPTLKEFITFFCTQKGFTNTVGKQVENNIFFNKYSNTINGLTKEQSFEFTKNDVPKTYTNMLNLKDIKKVVCFDDSWQEQNFFIELELYWVLYHWNIIS